MLLDNPTLQGIVEGRIRVVFRTWQKPTVKAGGSLRTRMGVLAIEAVDPIRLQDVGAGDLKLAGYRDLQALKAGLAGRTGTLYRIRLKHAGEDPRIALRQQTLSADELPKISARLERMDKASDSGPWTRQYLETIEARPAQRAPELAELYGLETKPFKQRVRRLKELGLTESLKVGYRLSPRGISYLAQLRGKPKPKSAKKKR